MDTDPADSSSDQQTADSDDSVSERLIERRRSHKMFSSHWWHDHDVACSGGITNGYDRDSQSASTLTCCLPTARRWRQPLNRC